MISFCFWAFLLKIIISVQLSKESNKEKIKMERAVITFIVNKIGDLLIEEAVFLKEVRPRIERLQGDLRAIDSFLEVADAKEEEDPRVRNWVADIRNVAYDVEDVVDMFILKAKTLRRKIIFNRKIAKPLNLRNLGKKIDDIQTKLEDISKRRERLGIKNIGEGTSSSSQKLQNLRRTTPRAETYVIVGLNEKVDKLVEQLTTGDQRLQVISIVGLGGIGKTTLAKKIYNDARIVDHFQPCRAWVYVSQDCKLKDIFQQILNQCDYTPTEEEAKKIEKMQENELGDFLHDHLKQKIFLVVVDDIWESDDWKCIAKAFPQESNGSRVLLTTRKKDIALHADPQTKPLEMQFLSKQESWDLFCRRAGVESCPPDLKELGQEMVDKCSGLPLAIVVLGGLLSGDMSRIKWKKVHDNIHAYLAKQDQMTVMTVGTVLNLSYIDLPSYLKPCFLLLSLFPEDCVISTRKLLFLWIAEGFVLKQDPQSKKESAEVYLNELINRNLIQVVRMSVNARVMECRVHDLVRDLAIKKAEQQNFLATNIADPVSPSTSSSLLVSCKSRRQSIYSDFERYASIKHSTPYLRSLLFFNLGHETCRVSQLDFIAKCFKVLRVLDLEGLEIKSLPSKVGKLIHLRYLGLRRTGLKTLPSSIGDLRSLQTLDVKNLNRVPNVICKMKNLQYLYIGGQEEDVRLQIDTLQNLQILSGISFKQWSQNDSSKLTCLEKLKLEGRCETEEVEFSNSIVRLHGLKSLHLEASEESIIPALTMNSWPRDLSKLEMKGHLQNLPEAHQFPPNLTQLTLEASKLDCDVMPILEKLPKLLILRLRADSYLGREMHVSASGFARLKVLELDELTRLTRLTIEKGAMPWLMQFQFYYRTKIFGLNDLLRLVEAKILAEPSDDLVLSLVLYGCNPTSFWDRTRITHRNGWPGIWFWRKKVKPGPSFQEPGPSSQAGCSTEVIDGVPFDINHNIALGIRKRVQQLLTPS